MGDARVSIGVTSPFYVALRDLVGSVSGTTKTLEHIFRDCPSIAGIWADLHITWPSEISDSCSQDRLFYIVQVFPITLSRKEKLPGRLIGPEQWPPPDGCCLKINFDATFHAPSRTSCAGVVVSRNIPSIFAAEAIAYLQVVCLGLALRFSDVVVEGDTLTVIRKANSFWSDTLVLGAYIRDIKRWAGFFRQCEFKHVFRTGNTVVDLLAKEELKAGLDFYLCGRVPDFMQRTVECDRRVVLRGD
ncbi:hypothetical protein CXB51_002956 [Gossypium anomalum]|uniref:RNase H type-1 domain-containing protein n=1 Tax=Gossypium anomalum TaxID=47600 RepID=A0A8J5ZFA9_9ROSI|nr:hypothetical protein CXB51_002956 [Gossypium anomalum]